MKESINPTERAIMETVREKTRKQLDRRVPDIDYIDHRRLTYLLIEDRLAAYKGAGIERTLSEVLAEFGVKSTHTYYDWYEKWHRLYARDKKNSERECVFRTFV